ncbi:hypothetical protein ElyMa_006374400 [Elysia marginata]|uniref:Uncharacterized protein n=1 Tax=Elysia marginata TaxID=1093978 RepID=A0AAV4HPR1_9GAST|nr:hypothetical protein ElyMa_006374400 [Elysia marginata]
MRHINQCRTHFGVRVHFFHSRRKKNLAATLVQLFYIVMESSGVAYKIFSWAKLQWINKDAGNNQIGLLQSHINKLHMAFMQITHSGYKSDNFTSQTGIPQTFT